MILACKRFWTALAIRVWLDDVRQHIATRAELRERIKVALDAAGIVMPYEALEIIHKSADTQSASAKGNLSAH